MARNTELALLGDIWANLFPATRICLGCCGAEPSGRKIIVTVHEGPHDPRQDQRSYEASLGDDCGSLPASRGHKLSSLGSRIRLSRTVQSLVNDYESSGQSKNSRERAPVSRGRRGCWSARSLPGCVLRLCRMSGRGSKPEPGAPGVREQGQIAVLVGSSGTTPRWSRTSIRAECGPVKPLLPEVRGFGSGSNPRPT